MSNRTDFDNQAAEFLEWQRSAAADEAKARLERELNDAFVAGQEQQERDESDLRAALAEALNGWQACNDRDYTEWRMHGGDDSPRIAEIRAKFLGGKR